jgi:AcrR family transcriptional regulator
VVTSVNGETLTANQAARRERVIDAALALADEGGYDAVQMRDVASRAQVALGTIYRYFTSKDHLLASCQLELWRDFAEYVGLHPLRGNSAADRVVHLLHRSMRAGERQPSRTEALVTSSVSPDPAVRACQIEIIVIIDRVLSDAMGGDVEGARAAEVATAMRHVWHAVTMAWVNGWLSAAEAARDLESAARLMLEG